MADTPVNAPSTKGVVATAEADVSKIKAKLIGLAAWLDAKWEAFSFRDFAKKHLKALAVVGAVFAAFVFIKIGADLAAPRVESFMGFGSTHSCKADLASVPVMPAAPVAKKVERKKVKVTHRAKHKPHATIGGFGFFN